MSKIKTSELTGTALDWAVEMASNPLLVWGETIGRHWASNNIVIPALKEPDCYRRSSTDWAQGGPIIEREGINLVCMRSAPRPKNIVWWDAQYFFLYDQSFRGETPLIAAMRCYVASKLGAEVEVPEELQ